jgi:hypothetical protein
MEERFAWAKGVEVLGSRGERLGNQIMNCLARIKWI